MGTVPEVKPVVSPERILEARKVVSEIYIDSKIKDYIIDIIFASREPGKYGLAELERFIEYGASPRASIALNQAAKAHAFMRHRGYVTPEDIKSIGPDVLRHRIAVTYEAEAEEFSSEDVVRKIFDTVEVP
jgi:MoxR-like ATPase